MWNIYDDLINSIPPGIMIDDYNSGSSWTMITAGNGCGVARTVMSQTRLGISSERIRGEQLHHIAAGVKSWSFTEASFGMAAINAYYNTPQNVTALGYELSPDVAKNKNNNAFDMFADECVGKNVAVIGHFPNIEKRLAPICSLSILERDPFDDDYPDSACEYILPYQDFVFITGMTFTNKTLPRLLQLCINAKVALVGPSVPLAPLLFDYGVDYLCGFCVIDKSLASDCIKKGSRGDVFSAGVMLDISKR